MVGRTVHRGLLPRSCVPALLATEFAIQFARTSRPPSRTSVGSGPVNDEVKAAVVVGWDACCGHLGEPLLRHNLTFGSDGVSRAWSP